MPRRHPVSEPPLLKAVNDTCEKDITLHKAVLEWTVLKSQLQFAIQE